MNKTDQPDEEAITNAKLLINAISKDFENGVRFFSCGKELKDLDSVLLAISTEKELKICETEEELKDVLLKIN